MIGTKNYKKLTPGAGESSKNCSYKFQELLANITNSAKGFLGWDLGRKLAKAYISTTH